ncbi:MAG TPA: chorismate-binding protein, partial [Candidatus Polarisedimenticolia bacterium]|nr:chorismate-binding protein [Candidatus Polarisedimenticolia bacterium]
MRSEGYNLDPADLRDLAKQGNIIPLCREISADLLTPVAAFLRLAPGARHPFLLESVEGGESVARYSFLGRDPSSVVRARLDGGAAGDPIEALRRAIAPCRAVRFTGLPRFTGGAVGYLSYDVVRLVERLPTPVRDDLRLPDVLFGLYDTVVAFDHLRDCLQIVSNIRTEENGRRLPERALAERYRRARSLIETTERRLLRSAAPARRRGRSRGRWSANISAARYKDNVRRAKEYIRAGDIFQVVLSQRFERRAAAGPFAIYRALRRINPSPYMYYFDFGEVSLAGASPEMLVRVEGDRIRT